MGNEVIYSNTAKDTAEDKRSSKWRSASNNLRKERKSNNAGESRKNETKGDSSATGGASPFRDRQHVTELSAIALTRADCITSLFVGVA